jgi:DNA-binding HxlR family transcriptional regulator
MLGVVLRPRSALKWKTVILAYLTKRPCRYGELRQMLPKLSDKVLS